MATGEGGGPAYRGPAPAAWTDEELAAEAAIGPEARADADRLWRAAVPRRLRAALDAPGPGRGPGEAEAEAEADGEP
jgi:hypothetical protein